MTKKITQEKILQAAFELFSERGFLGTTTKEIANKAGVAEVTLFRYFPSKEDLFTAVINAYSFIPRLKDVLGEIQNLPCEEALFKIAWSFLEVLENKKELIKLMTLEMVRYPEKIRQIYELLIKEGLELLSMYFENLKKQGKIEVSNPYLASSAFLGMFFSYFYIRELQGLLQDRDFEKKEVVKTFVELFVNGIKKGSCRTKKLEYHKKQ